MIKLQCKQCAANLQGDNNSQVYFCLKCSLAYNLEKNGLISFPVEYQKPQLDIEGESFYFPFWFFKTSWSTNLEPDNRTFFCWVTAFFIRNINNFGDIGQFYTLRNVQLLPDKKKKFKMTVADRNLNTALRYPEVYLYLKERTHKNFEELKINVLVEEVKMVFVPFFLKNELLYDSQLNCQYPKGALI